MEEIKACIGEERRLYRAAVAALRVERDALLRENERYSEHVKWQEERANKAESERDAL
jgi:hypothetical protein